MQQKKKTGDKQTYIDKTFKCLLRHSGITYPFFCACLICSWVGAITSITRASFHLYPEDTDSTLSPIKYRSLTKRKTSSAISRKPVRFVLLATNSTGTFKIFGKRLSILLAFSSLSNASAYVKFDFPVREHDHTVDWHRMTRWQNSLQIFKNQCIFE